MVTKTERDRAPISASQTPDATVVCACANLTLGGLKDLLAGKAGADFDQLLERTGAGKTCTACMLDLEYYFSACRTADGRTAAGGQGDGARRPESGAGLKARLFAALDRISPLVAVEKIEWMPVLAGARVEQSLLIANQSLLYKKTAASTVRIGVLVRDAEGAERHRESRDLREGEVMTTNLSRYLPEPPVSGSSHHGLGVGSVMISRKALQPGMWGTTRPQVEIVTPRAACVVHSQGPTGQREQWFTCLHRPGQERAFYSVVNVWNAPLEVEATCYLGGAGAAMREAIGERFVVPASGARLREVRIPEDRRGAEAGGLLHLRWRCSGPRKIHFFCADPDLSRFSIDHL